MASRELRASRRELADRFPPPESRFWHVHPKYEQKRSEPSPGVKLHLLSCSFFFAERNSLWQPWKPRRACTSRLHETPYKNEAFVDFTKEENVRKMRNALDKVRGQLGREYDLIIGGKRIKTSDKIRSINPAKPSEVVGIHQKAGKEHVEPAVECGAESVCDLEPYHRRRARIAAVPRRRYHARAQAGIHGLAGL